MGHFGAPDIALSSRFAANGHIYSDFHLFYWRRLLYQDAINEIYGGDMAFTPPDLPYAHDALAD